MNALTQALRGAGPALMSELEALYKDLHQHPELSMQEVRTARIAAAALEAAGYAVTRGVGLTGVVGVLRHGAGPTVMLRADMDALPTPAATPATAKEKSGAPGAVPEGAHKAGAMGGEGKVWASAKSKAYHCEGTKLYGKTKDGTYMTEADAKAKGYHAEHGKACAK